MEPSPPRCFVCRARDWREGRALLYAGGHRRAFRLQCGHCGALCDDPGDAEAAKDALHHALLATRFTLAADAPFGFDIHTLRTLATARHRAALPDGPTQGQALARPHSELAASARLRPFPEIARPAVTLAILARAAEAQTVLAAALDHARRWADDVVLLLDGAPPDGLRSPDPRVRLHARPLAGDFAAQRNAAQDLARQPFVLQLDADETVDAPFVAALGGLVEMAERDGLLSVGFPRRNRVDGVESDLAPDIQYRLNRRAVRFRGAVHERPDWPGGWRESAIALSGTITHHLSRAHVLSRSATYESILPGGGRSFEAEALLRPYRP